MKSRACSRRRRRPLQNNSRLRLKSIATLSASSFFFIVHPYLFCNLFVPSAANLRSMQQQRRARFAAAAAAAATILVISLTILDIRNPLEALGFIYNHVYPGVGYSRYASSAYPRAFIPRVALPLSPRTTDLHFPVDIGSDYSGGVGMQV